MPGDRKSWQAIPLRQIIDEGRISPERAVDIAARAARAIHAVHERGRVHGSIHPSSVLIGSGGDVAIDESALIAEAGTRATHEVDAVTSEVAAYISPEQARGSDIDHRSDIYSLGVVLFEMLTGTVPFQGSSPAAVAYRHVNVLPDRLDEVDPELPSDLAHIVEKALAKHPDDRFQSGDEMAGDLARPLGELALAGEPVASMTGVEAEPSATAPPRSSWSRLVMASMILLLAAASAGVLPMLPASDRSSDDRSTADAGPAELESRRPSGVPEQAPRGYEANPANPWPGEFGPSQGATPRSGSAQPSPTTTSPSTSTAPTATASSTTTTTTDPSPTTTTTTVPTTTSTALTTTTTALTTTTTALTTTTTALTTTTTALTTTTTVPTTSTSAPAP